MSFGKILNFMIIHAVIRGNNITIICMNDFETLILRLIEVLGFNNHVRLEHLPIQKKNYSGQNRGVLVST